MFYEFLKLVLPPLFKVIFRFEVHGEKNIPLSGPLVLASNHASYLDPPLIGCASPRKAFFMAKEELFRGLPGRIYSSLGAFPVKRGASDVDAVKHALTILKDDRVLAIFPEGTRSKDGTLGKAGLGTAMMASKQRAPIVPTAIIGSGIKPFHPLWPKIKVIFGEPIYFPEGKISKDVLQDVTNKLMSEIGRLMQEYR